MTERVTMEKLVALCKSRDSFSRLGDLRWFGQHLGLRPLGGA